MIASRRHADIARALFAKAQIAIDEHGLDRSYFHGWKFVMNKPTWSYLCAEIDDFLTREAVMRERKMFGCPVEIDDRLDDDDIRFKLEVAFKE